MRCIRFISDVQHLEYTLYHNGCKEPRRLPPGSSRWPALDCPSELLSGLLIGLLIGFRIKLLIHGLFGACMFARGVVLMHASIAKSCGKC